MAGTYYLEIVTPNGKVHEGDVQSVVVPGAAGSFGIQAQHAPLISALETGALEMVDADGKRSVLAIGEGFVEVLSQGVKLLTDFTNRDEEIDRGRAEKARERALNRLQEHDEKLDKARANAALYRANARLKVIDRS